MRPPFETFKRATCRGSYVLGSACGHCERCTWERGQMSIGGEGIPTNGTYTTLCEMRIRVDESIEAGVIVMSHATKAAIDEHTKKIRDLVWNAFGVLSTEVFNK